MTERRIRTAYLTAAGVALVLLGVFAYLIASSQQQARNELEKRFRDRPSSTAALTNAIFALSTGSIRDQATQRLGRKRVTQADLEAYARRNTAVYVKLLDADEHLIAATGSTPLVARRNPLRPENRAATEQGRTMLSNVLPGPAPGSRVVEWSLPLDTRNGKRILVQGASAELLSSFLSGFLRQLPNRETTSSAIIDGHGIVIGSPDKGVRAGRRYPDRDLLAALQTNTNGGYELDGEARHFESEPVSDSTWKVVVARDDSTLYGAVNGSKRTLPWVIFGALVAAAMVGILLLRRIASQTAELERREINQQHAVEINDNILQRIALALYAQENGQDELSREKLTESLREAQRLVNRLLGTEDVAPGDLRRRERASTSDRV